MQEKSSINKLENIIGWVIAIILTIGLFVGGFLFALDIVHAESLTSTDIDNIKSVIDNFGCDSSGLDSYYNNITNYDTYYIIRMIDNDLNHKNVKVYFFNSALGMHLEFVNSNNVNYDECNFSDKYYLLSYINPTTSSSMCLYICNENNGTFQKRRYSSEYNSVSINGITYKDTGFESVDINSDPSFTKYSDTYYRRNDYDVISNVDSLFIYRDRTPCTLIDFSSFVSQYNNNINNTSGFNVFVYNDLGIDYVRFVPNGLVTVGSHYSNNPTITFDLVLNNDVIIPVTYDESAGYYFESIEYSKAYYEIPVVELLPSSIADFDNIYITNVVYTNEWSNPSESGTDKFYYVDKCWLKRTYNNEEIGQVSVSYESTDTGYSQQEITDIYNMITNASTLEGTFDIEKNLSGGSSSPISFSSFQDAVVREIECYHPTGTKTSDWINITIDGVTYDSGDNMYWLEYNSNSSQTFEHRYNYNVSPYSYVRENNYAGYYDIIYFIVHEQVYDSSGSGLSTLSNTYTRYYYFISNRYYSKLMLYREMDILHYIKLGNEGQEKIYDYLFYKINNIDDNAYHFFKDKLNIDNDIVDKIREIDNSITLSTDSIMDLLNRILNALLDINIEPVEPMDITPIVTRLDQILEKQSNSNLNNDWYKNFRQWLYEETDNNLLDTPHEWFIDKLPSIKSLYNIFGGHDTTFYYTPMMNVIDGYLHGQDLLNDETTYSIFYYKGTWSSGFNTSNFDSYHISNNEVQ